VTNLEHMEQKFTQSSYFADLHNTLSLTCRNVATFMHCSVFTLF